VRLNLEVALVWEMVQVERSSHIAEKEPSSGGFATKAWGTKRRSSCYAVYCAFKVSL